MLKQSLKIVLNFLCLVLALPFFIFWKLLSLVLGDREALQGPAQLFSLLPGRLGVFLRRAFYRLVLAECAPDVCLSFGVIVSDPRAKFASGVYIGPYSIVGRVSLRENVVVASQVSLLSGLKQHSVGQASEDGVFQAITIGEESWVGERSVVGADVGSFSVIGAGSVVVKPVGDKQVVAGNPAKLIKELE